MIGAFSDNSFVSAIVSELEAGRSVGVASIMATTGSMPRHEGVRLAAFEDGSLFGSMGGGMIEAIAERRARDALAGRSVTRLEWLTRDRMGISLGGDVLLGVRVLGSGSLPVMLELADLLQEEETAVVEEHWDDPSAPSLSLDVASAHHIGWDEDIMLYRELVQAPTTCHIFGAGHVGSALAPIAASTGFEVVVYDDRPDMADLARLPEASRMVSGPYDEIARDAKITPRDSVVVLTHGHASDAVVLEQVLPKCPAYVGCIGSAVKTEAVRTSLVEAGVPREQVERLHQPVGEDIGAVTPAEVAVAIAAQLIRCRSERRPS